MKNRYILLVFFYSLLSNYATIAQSKITAISKDHSIHSFELVANLILLKGKVNEEVGWFILDTGMPDLILNQKYFNKDTSSEQFVSLSGKTTNISKQIATFSTGILKCKNKEVTVLDISQLEKKTNKKILGLVGHRLLKNKEIIIDYDQSTISFYKTQKDGSTKIPTHLPPPVEEITFQWKGHIPSITLNWQKHNLKFGIDTGASINLIDQKHEDKLIPMRRTSIKLVNIGNKSSNLKYSNILQLKLGRQSYPYMRMATYDISALNQQLPGKKMDGILGYQFLHRQRVAINYRNKTISMWDAFSEQQQLLVKMKSRVPQLREQ